MSKTTFSNKKIISISIILFLLAIFFWTGSRYPQLNEKALMGNDTPSMGISFDMVRDIQKGDGWVVQIFTNTLNWVDTNKKGMVFGILFGAALMVLFSLLKNLQSKNRWLNTFLGTVIGAPLGVCVNCAAPIAKGMKDAGAKAETALATMFSSPTLNIIVLSMLFAMLPPYMVWLKIGFTLLFILIFVPILSKVFPSKGSVSLPEQKSKLPQFAFQEESDSVISQNNTWLEATKWAIVSFFKSLWFLIKTTVPLMILAGFLGNLLITFLPLEGLVRYIPEQSMFNKIIFMGGIALLGAFLPVPIAFDVIITSILWSAGLPAQYAVILLFTLGSYSVYSAFIVNKSFSFKLSIALFFVVAGLGVMSGFLGGKLEKKLSHDYRAEHYNKLKISEQSPTFYRVDSKNKETIGKTGIDNLMSDTLQSSAVYETVDVSIIKQNHNLKDRGQNNWFKELEGQNVGLEVPYVFSVFEFVEPLANQRSIATGDVHKDGYPDVLMSSAGNLYLFANLKGEKFIRQQINVNQNSKAFNAALVDLDNDGWLDIFLSTYRKGNYVLYNDKGFFDKTELIRLPQLENMVLSQSASFADLNGDSLLDIVLGNWSLGSMGGREYSLPESQNIVLINRGKGNFDLAKLDENNGETLTTLITDFTGDGFADLWVGNDFELDDCFYENKGNSGKLEWLQKTNDIIEKTTNTTMSITAADVNNDLSEEIYLAQIDRGNSDVKTLDIDKICSSIIDKEQRAHCEEIFKRQKALMSSILTKNYESCPDEYKLDCAAIDMVYNRIKLDFLEESACEFLPKDGWDDFSWLCNFKLNEDRRYSLFQEPNIDIKHLGGILLEKDNNGFYKDQTDKFGVSKGGWTWNSKFADVDNDEYQDLFIVNGYLIKPLQESNIFYQNEKGQHFTDKTEESGLENYLPTSSYSYVDYDLDGDLDIIAATAVGPVFVYENNNHVNNSISFELKDSKGNFYGIGAKIYIYYGDGKHQIREVSASGGYKSFDAPVAYFGLGEYEAIEKVRVSWSNQTETIINQTLGSGATYIINRKD